MHKDTFTFIINDTDILSKVLTEDFQNIESLLSSADLGNVKLGLSIIDGLNNENLKLPIADHLKKVENFIILNGAVFLVNEIFNVKHGVIEVYLNSYAGTSKTTQHWTNIYTKIKLDLSLNFDNHKLRAILRDSDGNIEVIDGLLSSCRNFRFDGSTVMNTQFNITTEFEKSCMADQKWQQLWDSMDAFQAEKVFNDFKNTAPKLGKYSI